MKQLLRNLRMILIAFLALSLALIVGITIQQRKSQKMNWGHAGENKLALKGRYAEAASIFTRDGIALAESHGGERHYAEDPLLASGLLTLVGDYTHNIGNTLEERYENVLTGQGRPFWQQIVYDFTGRGMKGSSLRLSLESRLCRKAAELLQGHKAGLVLMDYRSGDLLAVANSPLVDPQNVILWKDIPEGALFNKAFLGKYPPGSTFKIITDAAWLAAPGYDPNLTVQCKGREALLGPGSVNEDRADAGHGLIGREVALAHSCNHFFGTVGIRAGAPALLTKARAFGLGKELAPGGLNCASNEVVLPDDTDDYLLSWFAIGQAIENTELSISPIRLAMLSAAVANGGELMRPRLVLETEDANGQRHNAEQPELFSRTGSAAEMAVLRSDMIVSASSGFARSAQVPGEVVGGKTGTAQFQSPDGSVHSHALFTGFMQNETIPLAIGIVIEDEMTDISALAGQIFAAAEGIYRSGR